MKEKDGPMFPGGGYNDSNGLWHYDHRTVGEYRRDSIVFLFGIIILIPLLFVCIISAAVVLL